MTYLLGNRLRQALPAMIVWVTVLLLPPGIQAAEPSAQQILDAVDFKQHIGALLPPNLQFIDEKGKLVNLNQLNRDRPLVLAMAWLSCPNLCPMLLDQLSRITAELPFNTKDYTLAVVSIAPGETPEEARTLRANLQHRHGNQLASWHFLTGDKTQIDRLAGAVGFEYAYDSARSTYAHPSGLVIVEPGGRINRYLFGINPGAPDLKLALLEAGKGKLGNPVQQVLLRCYRYNPTNGKYSLEIVKILQVVGAVFLIGFAVLLIGVRPRSTAKRERP